MSKVSSLFHIVINTYCRKKTIPQEHKHELYKYINGVIEGCHSQLIRINGTENHLHILVDLHPTVSLASLVQAIKQSSNKWMSVNQSFPAFEHWGKEYFAFSVSHTSCENVKNYIINQEEHHRKLTFEEELKSILPMAGMEWKDHLLT